MSYTIGQKVVCIDNDCVEDMLTVGRVYKVTDVRSPIPDDGNGEQGSVQVRPNWGRKFFFFSSHFEPAWDEVDVD